MQPAPRIRRLRDWPTRLAALVEERRYQPFRWGPNDCAAWAADDVLAVTGQDLLAELRGGRSTALGARRREKAIGGMPAAIERAGLQQVLPTLAQRADLVLLRAQPGQKRGALAVCMGEQACAPGRDGLVWVPMREALRAWRV